MLPIKSSATSHPSELTIVFKESNMEFKWSYNYDNLLELAEDNDLNVEYSCREGECGVCQCELLAGQVEYLNSPGIELKNNQVLLCCSRPLTDLIIQK